MIVSDLGSDWFFCSKRWNKIMYEYI
jgi:hypothetical protein